MITFTDTARSIYDEYLRRVRSYMAAAATANPDEVIANVRDHVEREFENTPGPVGEGDLGEVLARLGRPEQWIPEEELSWWRRMIVRLRTGPEHWRLAYATFGLVLCGVLFGWMFCDTTSGRWRTSHYFNWEALYIFLVGSFVLARAAVAAAEPEEGLADGQKWLVYPSLVLPYALLLAALIACVPVLAGLIGFVVSYGLPHHPGSVVRHDFLAQSMGFAAEREDYAVFCAMYVAMVAAGVWWIFLGIVLLLHRPRRAMRAIFRPFCANMSKAWGVLGIVVGLMALALGGVAIVVASYHP